MGPEIPGMVSSGAVANEALKARLVTGEINRLISVIHKDQGEVALWE